MLNNVPTQPMDSATGAILMGQLRSWALVIAGIVAAKYGVNGDLVPLIASTLVALLMALWSYADKVATARSTHAAKVAISTALSLPAGSTETQLARAVLADPQPPVATVPLVLNSQPIDTRPTM
jgi:hypothetical protein